MQYKLSNEFAQMTISVSLFHHLLSLAMCYSWVPEDPLQTEEPQTDKQTPAAMDTYRIDLYCVKSRDAGDLSISLEKALKSINQKLKLSPIFEYYVNRVMGFEGKNQRNEIVNKFIKFLKQGEFFYYIVPSRPDL